MTVADLFTFLRTEDLSREVVIENPYYEDHHAEYPDISPYAPADVFITETGEVAILMGPLYA